MKIACVAPAHPYRGGISHFNVRLARELSSRHQCLLINFSRLYPGFLFPGRTQLDESGLKVAHPSERLIDSIAPWTWTRARSRIHSWGADAVILHWWHPFFAPVFRCICSGKVPPVKVAVCHNVIPHESGAVRRHMVRFGLSKMDGFIVHSRAETEELRRLFPSLPYRALFHPIYDIFGGENIPRGEARRKLSIAPDARVVLYFGLIRPYKGVEVLLRACHSLIDLAQLKVLVVGEIYSSRDRIQRLIGALPEGLVRLVDRYVPNEEVALWFRAADIVALPYISATQSGVVPIAYRCLRPVIVTRVGGLPEVVDDGSSGYIIEPNDPPALANAIHRHFDELNAPDLTAGIEAIRRRLSWERYARELETFIAELSGEGGDRERG